VPVWDGRTTARSVNFNIPDGHWLAAKRFHSDVCDVTGYDAAEFSGELLLELKAHVGRAAERVGQLVQDGPGEVR